MRTETVKIPLCNSYSTTSFSTPNLFSHKTQDEAILHMHTFSPLLASFCHQNVVFFTCLVHLPAYIERADQPARNQPACRSLCEKVFNGCQYAIKKLNFHWPSEISCEKFDDTNCVFRDDPKSKPIPRVSEACSNVSYHGGTPICSSLLSALPDTKYIVSVNGFNFTNYFNHTRQEQAIYELSTHSRLIQLLISQQPSVTVQNEVTQCLNDVRFLLCNLYLPRCGISRIQDYPITKTHCTNILGKNCSSAILQLRNRGYNIKWPPVDINCELFPGNVSSSSVVQFKTERTFGDLSAPPPAVNNGTVAENFLEIKWNKFPEAFKFGTTVETGILYRKSGSTAQYSHEHATNNNFILRGLNSSTSYEIYVGTVNNKSRYPGVLEKIVLTTLPQVEGVEQIKSGFCSSLYNVTKLPNIFGHKTQDEALLSMHLFGPLLDTACSSDLRTLICSAYLPNYLAKERRTQPPCKQLCQAVFDRCSYAIKKLNFKWPEELQCDGFQDNSLCYPPSPSPSPTNSDVCETVEEQSICSLITRVNGTDPYFKTVDRKFKNYFNHTSQQQAVYELSKHAKLLSIVSRLMATTFGERLKSLYAQCVQQLTYFLCSLYLPDCRAGIKISRQDCNNIVSQSHVCSGAVGILQTAYGYSISWPPVQIDCNSISPSVATPKYGIREIQFQSILPPPAGLRYNTQDNKMQLMWGDRFRLWLVASSLKFLFKPMKNEVSYSHTHAGPQNTSISLNIDTSKDYEIYISYVTVQSGMPGHFQRITYVAGTTVVDLPIDLGACQTFYRQTVLPNKFGDKDISKARSRMLPFFPLIYTLCHERLVSFLCSAFFPRYNFGVEQACKSTCDKILSSCSYAISRMKFLWPPGLKCDNFPSDNRCYDVTIPSNANPPPSASRELFRKRSVHECKPTTTKFCLFVTKQPRPDDGSSFNYFASTLSGGKVNYFNHTTTDQAIFELSRHLRLLTTLRQSRSRDRDSCTRDLVVLLCHLYLPACPPKQLPQAFCSNTLNSTSKCSQVVRDLNNAGHDLQWPPVQVNCLDKSWFSANTTFPSVTVDTRQITSEFDPPPPTHIKIARQTTKEISVGFRPLPHVGERRRESIVLYKGNNSETTYMVARQAPSFLPIIDVQKLSPGSGYELKVATLNDITLFPGIFRTLTRRTFDSGVVDIPSSVDICYNYYRKTLLPNMYVDETIQRAKQRFFPFYPLIHTSCSSELSTFLCSVFLPRYNPVTYSSQKPCRHACERVFQRCSYAIGQSRFSWPEELKCTNFANDPTCYNLTTETPSVDEQGSGVRLFILPDRRFTRSARAVQLQQCKPTPSTLICSQVTKVLLDGQGRIEEYFKDTFQDGTANYFNHVSTDQAVYELSKYLNLLSSLRWLGNSQSNNTCYRELVFLLCHLHLPPCPRLRVSQKTCEQALGTNSACFDAIKDLNNRGANFTWPPVKVSCQNDKWFSNTSNNTYVIRPRRDPVPPAPRKIEVTSQYAFNFNVIFQRIDNLNVAALYRTSGARQPYQYISPSASNSSISLSKLTPATDYEILLASLRATSGFPGAFVSFKSNTFGNCSNDTTGEEVAQGKFFWKEQSGTRRQIADCPYGKQTSLDGVAERLCKCDVDNVCKRPSWLEPETSVCKFKVINDSEVTLTLSSVFQMLVGGEISPQNASEQLVDITSTRAPEFEADDIILSTLILEGIVHGTKDLNKTGPNIVKIVDNLLNAKNTVFSESQRSSNASSRIIVVLQKFLETIPLQSGQSITQNEPNIAVYAKDYNATDFEGAGAASIRDAVDSFVVHDNQTGVEAEISKASISLPRTLFKNVDTKHQDQRISFVVYRTTSLFMRLNESKSGFHANTVRKKNSYVISGSVKDQRLTNLTDPVVTTYQPLEEGIDETTACVFWNFTEDDGSGDWSSIGCSYQGTIDGQVTCHCIHLTNFAILMDVQIGDRDETHDKALSIISYVGCAISLVGLILTIITILIFKDLRSKAPTQILLNFCIALSLTLIVFLAAAERSKTSSLAGCRAAAIALHYFVLAMFTWTSINAYNMYLAFVKVMPSYHSRFILKCCVVGWGLPAVIVLITAATSIEDYGDEDFCRIQGLPFQLGFLTPVLIILLLNSIAFVLIIRSLLNAGTKVTADKRATGLQQARRGSAILVVLGLTWLFGVLAIRDAKLVFQYLFCIFNSIQGLLVFLFYCVLSVETKNKYKKLLFGKSKESTETDKNRYNGMSEGRLREINWNNKRMSDTTSAGGSSSLSAIKITVEQTKL